MPATKQNSAEAYCDAHYEAVCLLDRLTDLVGDLPAPTDERPINWGHIGSLRHVIAALKDIETHLEGETK